MGLARTKPWSVLPEHSYQRTSGRESYAAILHGGRPFLVGNERPFIHNKTVGVDDFDHGLLTTVESLVPTYFMALNAACKATVS